MPNNIYDEFCELEARLGYTLSVSLAQKRNALQEYVIPYIFNNTQWNDEEKALRIQYVIHRPCFYQYYDKSEDLRNTCYAALDGNTPLIYAAAHGYYKSLQVIANAAKEIDQRNWSYRTALMEAAQFGHSNCINFLIRNHDALINAQDNNRDTALILAAKEQHADIVKILLKNKASLEIKNAEDLTALDVAVLSSHFDIAALLIKDGAKIQNPSKLLKAILEKKPQDDNAYTCLKTICSISYYDRLSREEYVQAKLYLRQLKAPFCERLKNFFMGNTSTEQNDEVTTPRLKIK
jgi:hypothetical protein